MGPQNFLKRKERVWLMGNKGKQDFAVRGRKKEARTVARFTKLWTCQART